MICTKTALSAVVPSATAALIGFVCPQQHRLRRAEVARVGFLVAPHHYASQDISVIGIAHQQGAAPRLFAGFRTRNELPHPRRRFAGFDPGANHFCLCRAGTTCASEASCREMSPSGPACGVRWYCLVSCPCAAL